MAFIAFTFLLAISWLQSVHGDGSYLITSPTSIIRGTGYDITVEILNTTNVDVEARLQERIYNGTTRRYDINVIKSIRGLFNRGSAGMLSMNIEDTLKCRSCQLHVRGRGGLQFERSTYVPIQSRLVSILIQTDKAIYKPGQTVFYRAIAVYPDLKVYKGPLHIEIKDPRNNRIKIETKSSASPNSGIVEGQLELSNQLPYGDWTIRVNLEETGDSETQVFTVADYELPRFEVQVELPPYKLTQDTDLAGTVKAKYTFGQPVKGRVELHVGPDQDADYCGKMPKTVETVFDIDGDTKFTIPKSDIKRITPIYNNSPIRVTAFVKESATGVRLNGSNSVTYYTNEYKVKFLDNTPSVFKPGLPYVAFVQVSTPDNMPPPLDAQSFVSIYAYATYKVEVEEAKLYGMSSFTGNFPLPGYNVSLPSNGVLPIGLNIPDNATSITINVHYKGQTARKTVSKTYSKSNNFVQLSLISQNLKAGDQATFSLQGTEPLTSVFCVVLSRGSVILHRNLNGRGAKSFTFSLPVNSEFAPTAHLLAYYNRKSEIIADSIAFNVDGIFKNKVSLAYNVDKTEPNKQVNLLVNADPYSVVGLLAVDQSVLLLKSGNDITAEKVKKAVSKFDPSEKPSDSAHALSYSSRSVGDVFSQTGLLVITDVQLSAPQPPPIYPPGRGPIADKAFAYSFKMTRSYNQSPAMVEDIVEPMNYGDFQQIPAPSETMHLKRVKRIRHIFTEAWLWKMHNIRPTMIPTTTRAFEEAGGATSETGSSLKKVERLRKLFPESWLWQTRSVSASGQISINSTVPDTITSWVTTAFATNELTGLGVAPTAANVTVFRPFFVSLNYPSTVKRNEQAVIQATVFNYLSTDVTVVVTLKQSTAFQSMQASQTGANPLLTGNQQKNIQVRAGVQGVVYFPIVAQKIGVADIEVTAQTAIAADGVKRQIVIEAEGAPVSFNYPVFVTLDKTQTFRDTITPSLPSSYVSGSEKTRVKVTGDLIGASLDNIQSLLSLPTGCGEQSMVKFVPDLYIAKYLKSKNLWSPYMRRNIISLLNAGYQRQLTYQRQDGGFSAFGDSDEAASTWLTAYVSRTFNEAQEFIYVDPSLLKNSVDWLLDRQNKDGSFSEFGKVLDQNTQGSQRGPALTAFVLLALLQNKDIAPLKNCKLQHSCFRAEKLRNVTEKAIMNLESQLTSTNDLFSIAVVSYALGEAKSRKSNEAFQRLLFRATYAGSLTYWSANASSSPRTPSYSQYRSWQPPHPQARPIDILITSYALLSYVSRQRLHEGIPALQWLIKQRNSMGGFASTQDTAVALQALAAYAANTNTSSTRLDIRISDETNAIKTFSINPETALFLRTQTFATQPRTIQLEVIGTGFALVEFDYNFNVKEALSTPSFDVSTVLLDDDIDSFNLMICTKWLWDRKTGMVVQEIGIPSGFSPDLSTLGNVVGMKRSERRGNMVAIYFDEIGKTSTCFSILMTRVGKVAKSEQSYIRTYDYYEPSDKSTVFYQPTKLRDSTICDVCKDCCV